MKTIELTTNPDTDAIIQSLVSGKPLDPEIRDRLRRDGDRVREQLRQKIGPTNMAAELIRESRDE